MPIEEIAMAKGCTPAQVALDDAWTRYRTAMKAQAGIVKLTGRDLADQNRS